MRYLILSDIHSNLEALQAVEEAARGTHDRIVCCGDLVGYGADPNAVVDWVRANVTVVVRGNHDKACAGLCGTEGFNQAARASASWTHDRLTRENLEYLAKLPKGPCDVEAEFSILHGSPRDEDEYVPDIYKAFEVFDSMPDLLTFFGHTHIQGGFYRRDLQNPAPPGQAAESAKVMKVTEATLDLVPGHYYYLNPGSVGQPRDVNPKAAYAIYDTNANRVEFARVEYDITSAMNKILQAGLPEVLAYRLRIGR